MELRHQQLIRYILPLREGGSLPALAQADDSFRYVIKFKGGGHGTKAVISELIGGSLASRAGLRVPELVFLDIDPLFGITEPDEEIQDLLKASQGLNIGLHFLEGAATFDPYTHRLDPLEASLIVWIDAFMLNVDRTHRNTNMLWWNRECWLIDHGSSLYFHHNWADREKAVTSPFPYIKDHALLGQATKLEEADKIMTQRITPDVIRDITDTIPDEWLQWDGVEETPDQLREQYRDILTRRLENSSIFVNQAILASKQ